MPKAMPKTNYKTVDEYIADQTPANQEALEQLRQIIRDLVPQAEEGISYQIPMYKYHGMLCGFAAFSKHLNFTTANNGTIERFKNELKGYKHTPSSVHFTPEKPLPIEVLEQIILTRVAENEAKVLAKKK
jgi:uncharacterized protein YdhG (YjbR/CyaY superfamily)